VIKVPYCLRVTEEQKIYEKLIQSADPVHVMLVLEDAIRREQFSPDTERKYLNYIKEWLVPKYADFIGNEIQTAYLESYDDFGQNLFDRYLDYADAWLQDTDFKDPDTGNLFNRELLNNELEKIEKAAGIANPKDFRHEVVNFVLRKRAKEGAGVRWTSYQKLRRVIEKKMFASVEELLPVISFGAKQDSETEQKHKDFVSRMVAKGYTARQVRRVVDWYQRVRKSG
jgi:serine protein kinase